MAQDNSESWVHERRLRLSEPTADHVSSTMHDLGMHVDRRACLVLEIEDGEAIAPERIEPVDQLELGQPMRRAGEAARSGRGCEARRRSPAARVQRPARRRTALRRPPTTGTGPRCRSVNGRARTPCGRRARCCARLGGERVAGVASQGTCAGPAPRSCPAGGGSACGPATGRGDGLAGQPGRSAAIGVRRSSGVGSSHRSRKVWLEVADGRAPDSIWTSCHGGRSPYRSSRSSGCGSPRCWASSRRP